MKWIGFILKAVGVLIFVISIFLVGITLWVNERWIEFILYSGALSYLIGSIIDDLED